MATKNKEIKHGAFCILSGSKTTKDAVYGAKIWHGQGTVNTGDMAVLLNWQGRETLVYLGNKVDSVPANPAKGQMGYDRYELVKLTK